MTTTTSDTPTEAPAFAESKQATAIRYVRDYTKALLTIDGKVRLESRSGLIYVGDKTCDLNSLVTIARSRLGCIPEAVYTTPKGAPRVVEISRDDMRDAIELIAKGDQFDPVRRYLDRLPAWDHIDRSQALLDALRLDEPKPLHRTMLRRTLIAAVARVFDPGCKVDTICVLHAPEGGEGKSTFWRKLFGGKELFSDSRIDLESKDGMQKVDRHWIHEWSEMAALKSNASGETIKAFLSSPRDDYRKPYAATVTSHPRRSLFVGTTNDAVFLRDNGGNRRFWIIPNVGRMDQGWVEANQAQILAQAVYEYKRGDRWWLDEAEQAENAADQREHTHEAPGADLVAKYVGGRESVTTAEIVAKFGAVAFCGLGLGSQQSAQAKVADILRRLGWKVGGRKDNVRFYVLPVAASGKGSLSKTSSVFGVAKFN